MTWTTRPTASTTWERTHHSGCIISTIEPPESSAIRCVRLPHGGGVSAIVTGEWTDADADAVADALVAFMASTPGRRTPDLAAITMETFDGRR